MENNHDASPLVSVIIPCFNYGDYLEEAVQSVLQQTYRNIEIIVVDDASTDQHTIDVIQKLETSKSIKVIRHESNKKLAATRNTGISASAGVYILPLDADDTIDSSFIEKTVLVLEENPNVGFVNTAIRYFGDEEGIWTPPEFDFRTLLHQNIVGSVTSLFRKQAWEEVGGFDESFIYGYEDWEFWISVAKKGWQGLLIKEPLFNYRKHGKSLIDDAISNHALIMSQIMKIHHDLYYPSTPIKTKNNAYNRSHRRSQSTSFKSSFKKNR